MLKKICYAVLCAGALISANSMASTQALPTRGLDIQYDFEPNIPQTLINYSLWTITASCTVSTEDDSDELRVTGIRGSGEINGQVITAGKQLTLIVQKGQQFTLSAKSGAKVELTNLGKHTLTTACKTI